MNHTPFNAISPIHGRWLYALLFALVLGVSTTGGAAARQPDDTPPANTFGSASPASVLPFTYARVTGAGLPIYANPAEQPAGVAPVRVIPKGYVGVSLANSEPLLQGEEAWYQINPNEYVRAQDVTLLKPSEYQGVAVTGKPRNAFGWIVSNVRVSATPGAAPAPKATLLPRYTLVSVLEERRVGAWTWYRIGKDEWIEQRRIGLVKPSARPEGVGEHDKWIDVNLYEQTLAAYQGDEMVYAALISSGLPGWNTPRGLFRIWAKVAQSKMSGRDGHPDYYFLEDVPWILYFNGDVALHGAYWHDGFGTRRSHGCVNLSPRDAQWVFDWATPVPGRSNWTLSSPENPGTFVWVH